MKQFYVKIHETHEGLYIDAEEIFEDGNRLCFYKDDERIAVIKEWDYWLEVFE